MNQQDTPAHDIEFSLPISELTLRGTMWPSSQNPTRRTLCLHGWLDNSQSFAPLAQALPKASLIALDLPGHGHSDHLPPAAHYHIRPMLGYLIELIETQEWQDLDLIGHCIGGVLCLLLAAALPERIRRVITLDTTHPELATPEALCDSTIGHYRSRLNRRYESHPVYNDAKQVSQLRRAGSDMLYTTAAKLTARDLCEIERGVTLRSDPRLRRPFYTCFTEELYLAYLRRIQAPVLWIAAEREPPAGESKNQQSAQAIHQICIQRIAGGHYVHMENVEPVARVISEFLHQKNPS